MATATAFRSLPISSLILAHWQLSFSLSFSQHRVPWPWLPSYKGKDPEERERGVGRDRERERGVGRDREKE